MILKLLECFDQNTFKLHGLCMRKVLGPVFNVVIAVLSLNYGKKKLATLKR